MTSGTSAIGSIRLGGRRTAMRAEGVVGVRGRPGALLVAADATRRLAGLDGEEALHALDGKVVLVQRDEEEAAQGGQFEVGRAVRLDRHRADDPLEREGAAVADRLHAAGVVDRHGQRSSTSSFLISPRLHAGHVAAVVDVGQHQAAGAPRRDRTRSGMIALAGPRHERARLVQLHAGLGVRVGQLEDLLLLRPSRP